MSDMFILFSHGTAPFMKYITLFPYKNNCHACPDSGCVCVGGGGGGGGGAQTDYVIVCPRYY